MLQINANTLQSIHLRKHTYCYMHILQHLHIETHFHILYIQLHIYSLMYMNLYHFIITFECFLNQIVPSSKCLIAYGGYFLYKSSLIFIQMIMCRSPYALVGLLYLFILCFSVKAMAMLGQFLFFVKMICCNS